MFKTQINCVKYIIWWKYSAILVAVMCFSFGIANCNDANIFPKTVYYTLHDGFIKWKYFMRYWPFMGGIHRSPVTFPHKGHKGHWRGALMFSLICTLTKGWVNNWDAGDLRHHRAHHNVIVMKLSQYTADYKIQDLRVMTARFRHRENHDDC